MIQGKRKINSDADERIRRWKMMIKEEKKEEEDDSTKEKIDGRQNLENREIP